MEKIKSMVYKVLDAVTPGEGIERCVSGTTLRLPPRYSRYFESDYESDSVAKVRKIVKSGMFVVDIGAHIGLYSVVLAQCVGQTGTVVAFEPTPNTFEILTETVRLNGLKNIVHLRQMAVGKSEGTVDFYASDIGVDNSNSLAQYGASEKSTVSVKMTSLDAHLSTFDKGQVGFVKIDAEGAELGVLEGAKQLLEKDRPMVLLGLHPNAIKAFGDSLEAIWDFVVAMSYEVELDGVRLTKSDFTAHDELFDVFLIPAQN